MTSAEETRSEMTCPGKTRAPANVGILCSFGAQAGYGHLRRCLTLAQSLHTAGSAITFYIITSEKLAAFAGELSEYEVVFVPDIGHFRLERRHALLVIDSYLVDLSLEQQLIDQADRILLMEDLPNRKHVAGMILDPTHGRQRRDYDPVVPSQTGGFIGPRYALIRDVFRRREQASRRDPSGHIKPRILIAFGGTDPVNASGQVLRALDGMTADIDIVLGSRAPYLRTIRHQAEGRANLHVDINGAEMAGLMHRADLCIGAGGGGAWERCAAGVATLAYEIVENQRDVLGGLAAIGAIEHGGKISDAGDAGIRQSVKVLLSDPDRLASLTRAGSIVCDGKGAIRVAAYLSEASTGDNQSVRLRPAAPADRDRILEWQSSPGARRYARNTAIPSQEEHADWFERRLAETDAPFAIVELDGAAVGFVRLDRAKAEDGFEVAILIASGYSGRGIGQAALRLATHLEPDARLLAEVHPDNTASQRIFSAAGFVLDGDNSWYYGPDVSLSGKEGVLA